MLQNEKFDLFNQPALPFEGSDFNKEQDGLRLTKQLKKIVDLMKDQKYRTLSEIQAATFIPQSSISAQLRHLRKEKFGKNIVNKRPRDDRKDGLFEYQLILNPNTKIDG